MRILIAEDDAASRLLLTRVLVKWGYEVTATKDGAEAWVELQTKDAPHLAILDWMMPGMDGVDVCRRVRALETLQPPYIILLTALGDKESVVTGLEAGADDYVGKPYDAAELHARLEVGRRLVELNEALLEAKYALEVLARTDALTGVLNRGAIVRELEKEAERAAREGTRLGLGMLDIDHFKLVNDTYGHAAGDAVLCTVAQRVLGVMRAYDTFGRFGGEEFLVLVPGSGEEELRDVLERLRAAIGSTPIVVDGQEFAVTASLGGATGGDESADGLIARADDALYAAKKGGRNRVAMAAGQASRSASRSAPAQFLNAPR
jgi:diguanylate cyclase (GGDEF)-like protein